MAKTAWTKALERELVRMGNEAIERRALRAYHRSGGVESGLAQVVGNEVTLYNVNGVLARYRISKTNHRKHKPSCSLPPLALANVWLGLVPPAASAD